MTTQTHEDFASPYRVPAELRIISSILMGILTMLFWIAALPLLFIIIGATAAVVLFLQGCVIESTANFVEGRDRYLFFRKNEPAK